MLHLLPLRGSFFQESVGYDLDSFSQKNEYNLKYNSFNFNDQFNNFHGNRRTFNRYATRPVSLYMYLKRKLISKCNIRFTGKYFVSNLYSLNDFYERYHKKNFRYKYQIDDKY